MQTQSVGERRGLTVGNMPSSRVKEESQKEETKQLGH